MYQHQTEFFQSIPEGHQQYHYTVSITRTTTVFCSYELPFVRKCYRHNLHQLGTKLWHKVCMFISLCVCSLHISTSFLLHIHIQQVLHMSQLWFQKTVCIS